MKVVVHNLSSDLEKKMLLLKSNGKQGKISRMVRFKIGKFPFLFPLCGKFFSKKTLEKKSNLWFMIECMQNAQTKLHPDMLYNNSEPCVFSP